MGRSTARPESGEHRAERDSTTMRMQKQTHERVRALAREEHVSMQEIVDRAIDLYRRQQLLAAANACYATMRADPVASAAFDAEHRLFEGAIVAGLGDDDAYPI